VSLKNKLIFNFILTFLVILLSACGTEDNNPNSGNGNDDPEQKTTIVFDNSQGTCTAYVYRTLPRNENNKIAEIPAGELSEEIEWQPGDSVPFFFSYNLEIIGISGLTLDYISDMGYGSNLCSHRQG